MLVYLQGGLGNQLFEYAFGRSLSLLRGCPLYFDKTRLNPYSVFWGREGHGFFPVITAYPLYGLGAYEIQVNLGYPIGPLYKENKSGIYEPEVMQAQTDTVFDGIWGNEGYYHDPALIRKELTRPVGEPDDDTKRVAEDIDRTKNSCFVSVRRGEYRYLGCCLPLEYYLAGMKRVASGHPGTKFFIFTDDREWCREHFHKPGCTVVGHSRLNGADGPGDDPLGPMADEHDETRRPFQQFIRMVGGMAQPGQRNYRGSQWRCVS